MITRDKFNPEVFKDIVQSVPVGIVALSQSGEIESWNLAAERILGWSAAEVTGRPMPIELPDSSIENDVEVVRGRKDGTAVTIQVHTMPWHDANGVEIGALVILTDVTARRRAETGEREYARFRDLLEAAPDAIIEVDQEGKIVLLNRVTEQLFGYQRQELLGQLVEILIPQSLRHTHREHRDEYRASPSTRPMGTGLLLEGERKDGTRFPVEISLSPVEFSGGFRVSAIIRDVSERFRAEERLKAVQSAYTQELAAKNHELELRNEEVERANRLKSEFLSGMSHELRTPLHTIIGFTELLEEQLEGPLNEKQQRFIHHIHKDSQHLLALINDVLDLSKIESGRLELQREMFSVLEASEETVSSIRPRGQAKSIQIEIEAESGIEVWADRLRFKQILYNLLSNAVKFTPANGRVWVHVHQQEGAVEICVGDTGIGIPPSEQESVFDKFYQVGQKQAAGLEGTGLGLAITRHLVEQHGGVIRLESEPGQGSRFTFTIASAQSAKS